jgi:hypothetical protein
MAAFAAAPALSSRAFFAKSSVRAKKTSVRAQARAALKVEAKKKSVGDLKKADLEGKTVFVRCDLNVPLDKDLKITDDTRIRAAVPTIEYLVENGAKVLVTSHLVRPRLPMASRQIYAPFFIPVSLIPGYDQPPARAPQGPPRAGRRVSGATIGCSVEFTRRNTRAFPHRTARHARTHRAFVPNPAAMFRDRALRMTRTLSVA